MTNFHRWEIAGKFPKLTIDGLDCLIFLLILDYTFVHLSITIFLKSSVTYCSFISGYWRFLNSYRYC